MIRTFENLKNLQSFSIQGFKTKSLTSFHKTFYNSGVSILNLRGVIEGQFLDTSNVNDMSFILAGTDINKYSFSDYDANKLKNVSNMFANCSSLTLVITESKDPNLTAPNMVDMLSIMF